METVDKNISPLFGDWDAVDTMKPLVERNILARKYGFGFCVVSGLSGFEGALGSMQETPAILAMSDCCDGFLEMNNTPRTRRVIQFFMAMRHAESDPDARVKCLRVMREIFRQLMSALLRRNIFAPGRHSYLDSRVSYQEIDKYFYNGAACCVFQLSSDIYADLIYREDEWL